MNENDLQDVRLVQRVAAGDRDAFGALFDRHGRIVLGILVRMLSSAPEAEEVLQEVFLQVWTGADRYRPERGTPVGWMVMMARSRALDRLRSDRARVRREDTIGREAPTLSADPSSLERLEVSDRRREVLELLGTLPPDQRECLELAFFDGLTHSEIAERLGAPLGTVKSRILMAMRKLRVALAP